MTGVAIAISVNARDLGAVNLTARGYNGYRKFVSQYLLCVKLGLAIRPLMQLPNNIENSYKYFWFHNEVQKQAMWLYNTLSLIFSRLVQV